MNSSQTMDMAHGMRHEVSTKKAAPYRDLLMASVFHFLIMYAVMFTMVDRAGNIILNLNNVFMTGMMLAPMTILMILTMRTMYPNKKLNTAIIVGAALVFGAFYVFMRQQIFIGDKEFVRSMVPHHSGAILMCEEASIKDQELRTLCDNIIKGQQGEIDQMKAILKRL